jgi:hypothetical protein
MRKPKDDIFPTAKSIKHGFATEHKRGLSVREYYAAMAMQGMMSVALNLKARTLAPEISETAFRIADAMIAESNK